MFDWFGQHHHYGVEMFLRGIVDEIDLANPLTGNPRNPDADNVDELRGDGFRRAAEQRHLQMLKARGMLAEGAEAMM